MTALPKVLTDSDMIFEFTAN